MLQNVLPKSAVSSSLSGTSSSVIACSRRRRQKLTWNSCPGVSALWLDNVFPGVHWASRDPSLLTQITSWEPATAKSYCICLCQIPTIQSLANYKPFLKHGKRSICDLGIYNGMHCTALRVNTCYILFFKSSDPSPQLYRFLTTFWKKEHISS